MEPTQARPSCFARMLDIRSMITAARGMMLSVDATTAVVLILIFGFIGLCLSPIYIGYDLASTWSWAAPVQEAARPTIDSMAYAVEGAAPAGATLMGMTIGELMAAMVLVGITLLPSLFELGFPSMRHPLLMLLLTGAILFDYITDFSTSWAATAGWSGADNWFVHFFWTAFVFNPFVSIGVQAVLVLCLTVVIFGFIRLVTGAARPALAEAVVISR